MKKTTILLALVLMAYPVTAQLGLANAEHVLQAQAYEVRVEELNPHSTYLRIVPPSRYVRNGREAVYELTLYDGHEPCTADSQDKCTYEYEILVEGVPFEVEIPEKIEVGAGQKVRFKMIVDTNSSNDVTDEEQDTGISSVILAKRPYRFVVYAVSEDVKTQANAVLYVGYAIPQPVPIPYERVQVKIDEGWNIVSLPGTGTLAKPILSTHVSDENVEMILKYEQDNRRKYFFVYLKDEQRYATFAQAIKHMGPRRFREYLKSNAFWVYSAEIDVFTFKVSHFTKYEGMPVTGGWNFIPVTGDMKGKTMGEIKKGCEFEGLYMFDSGIQDWVRIGLEDAFQSGELYSGVVAKAKADCELGDPTPDIPSPPQLPG